MPPADADVTLMPSPPARRADDFDDYAALRYGAIERDMRNMRLLSAPRGESAH